MRRLIVFCWVLSCMPIGEAHAYVGPGLGLGALGVVLGLLLSMALAVLGLVWYPLKRVLGKSKRQGRERFARPTHQPTENDDAS